MFLSLNEIPEEYRAVISRLIYEGIIETDEEGMLKYPLTADMLYMIKLMIRLK